MRVKHLSIYLSISFFLLTAIGCNEKYTPKPYGYYRIDFPPKAYQLSSSDFPYRFEKAVNATVEIDSDKYAEPYWINLVYPAYNAKIHLSYKTITTDTSLQSYIQDCHQLAYTHTIKAESIDEKLFRRDNIFGLVYFIEGNTASSTQFFITDSTRHFLRGALYFNQHPDKDSLAPVIQYLREDILTLMETLEFRPTPPPPPVINCFPVTDKNVLPRHTNKDISRE